jgi:hypothetical protein
LKYSRALNHSSVKNNKLQFSVRPSLPWLSHESLDTNAVFFDWLNEYEPPHKICAKKVAYPNLVIFRGGGLPDHSTIAQKCHSNVRMRDGE